MATYPRRLSLTNPGFETGSAPGDGWTTVNGTPVFRTASPGPDLRDSARYLHVNNTGVAGSYRVRQDVAIPADCHTDVDAGLVSASLRFLWANYGAGSDIGFVELAFLNGTDAVIATAASGRRPPALCRAARRHRYQRGAGRPGLRRADRNDGHQPRRGQATLPRRTRLTDLSITSGGAVTSTSIGVG